LGVSGNSLVGSANDVRNGTETATFSLLHGVAVDAPLGKYFMVNSDSSTVNQIVVGDVAGGAPSVLYSAPGALANYALSGLAIDQPNHTLYLSLNSSVAAQKGIYKIDEITGVATAVVVGQGIRSPDYLAIDSNDGLVFFADLLVTSNVNNLDVGNLSTGTVTVLNSQLSSIQSQLAVNLTAANSAGLLLGVDVDGANNVLYFTATNGANAQHNYIFKVPYTVSAGAVTLGAVTTLYSGTAAGSPGDIAIDVAGGVFYVGNFKDNSVYSGSLNGGGSLTKIYQQSTILGVQPRGLFFLSTPTVTAGGSVTFAQGGSPVVLNSSLTLANPDGQNLASAIVKVAGGSAANGETLAANTAGTSIVASYNSATETLTLSGNDTLAHYQTVLRSVTFSSTGVTAGARTINWTVSDGIITSTTPTSTVTVLTNATAPTITSTASASEAENTAASSVVYTVVATDPDPVGSVTYSLTGTDAAKFSIDAVTGQVRFLVAPDFEIPTDANADNAYLVVAHASDGVHDTTKNVSISVTNTDDTAPTVTSGAAASEVENTAASTVVYTVTASDPDTAAGSLTYTLAGGADALLFDIDGATGNVRFKASPDREAPADADGDNIYQIIVAASDGVRNGTKAVSITVTDANDVAPIITSGATSSVAENTPASSVVYTLVFSDPDILSGPGVYLTGQDSGRFSIDGSGQVRFLASPNFESPTDFDGDNVYQITVHANDGPHDAAKAVSITVTNVDEIAPTITSGASASVPEGTPASSVVYAATATDLDAVVPLSFSLSGVDAARFSIDAAGGQVRFLASPDFELPTDAGADNLYQITVHANDGAHDTTKDVSISVTNVIEGSPAPHLSSGAVSYFDAIGGVYVNLSTQLGKRGDVGASWAGGPSSVTLFLTDMLSGVQTATGSGFDDLLVAGTASAVLSGLAGSDTLTGGVGIDRLDGGAGADVMTGGGGNDTYFVDNPGDQVIEAVGEGNDVVYSSVNFTLVASQEIESLRASVSTGVKLTGNEFANELIGGAGNDTLEGGADNDRLYGEAGVDSMSGGTGNDVYTVDSESDHVIEAVSEGNDVVYTSSNFTLAASQEIESLRATVSTGLILTGNEFANELIGGAGNDTLFGGAGNDRLHGGAGADSMSGGADNDLYTVDNPGDQVIEAVGEGNDLVYSTVNFTLAAGQEIESLRANASTGLTLTGNELANELIGGAGNDKLDGGVGGSDTLYGRGGDDIITTAGSSAFIRGENGNDTIQLNGSSSSTGSVDGGAGTDIVRSADLGKFTFQNVETLDTYYGFLAGSVAQLASFAAYIASLGDPLGTQIELSLRGAGGTLDFTTGISGPHSLGIQDAGLTSAINITGSVNADEIVGSTLNDTLKGGNGNDALYGGVGNDILNGGADHDLLNGGEGNDQLTGGSGVDTFAFDTGFGGGLNIDLVADFTSGTDLLQLDQTYFFTGLLLGQLTAAQFAVGAATAAGPQIVYNQGTGALFFDSDGTGAQAASQFATLTGGPVLVASDIRIV
jgi:Ca2+-binding RTX toxin-like protein